MKYVFTGSILLGRAVELDTLLLECIYSVLRIVFLIKTKSVSGALLMVLWARFMLLRTVIRNSYFWGKKNEQW